jgi:tripartite-type tricarboxylate transporter receptor subunit TctC
MNLPLPTRGRRLALRGLVAAGLAARVGRDAIAQEWPAKPLRLVAPFTPGGSADNLARLLAQHFSETWKQNVVVENRAGAGGAIGSELVAKAPPDGYTLVISGIASHVITAAVSKLPYHPINSFSHIALLGGPPAALCVHPDVPAKNVRELLALANANPQGLSWGSSGTGTHAHLIGEMLRDTARAKLVHVSYRGGAPAMTDLIGRQIPLTITALSSAMPHLRAGRIRALATTARTRLADLPEVPTFVEAGFPQLVAITWFSLSGPAGMPPAVVATINAEARRAMASARWRERTAGEGIEPNDLDAATFTQFVRTELERWTPLAKAAQPES